MANLENYLNQAWSGIGNDPQPQAKGGLFSGIVEGINSLTTPKGVGTTTSQLEAQALAESAQTQRTLIIIIALVFVLGIAAAAFVTLKK